MLVNDTLLRSVAVLLVLGVLFAAGTVFAEMSLQPASTGEQHGTGTGPDVYDIITSEDAMPGSQSAVQENYVGALRLDPLPPQAAAGSQVVFSGQLLTTAGHMVYDARIYIKDDIDFGSDDIIAEAVTDQDGRFSVTWNAVQRSSGLYDFYAVFEGSPDVSHARSQTYSMAVLAYHTTITLDPLPSSVAVGEQINFTGSLYTSQGAALRNAVIYIQDEDTGSGDDILAHGITDSNGRFSIPWVAQQQASEIDLDIRAVFEGSGPYLRSTTDIQKMSVLTHHTTITLDDLPATIYAGEQINFTGSLYTSQGAALRNAVIYIQDEDTGSGDDILAHGITDSNGRFSIPWVAQQQASEIELDIRAVFEGSGPYLRSTTDIQKMSVLAHRTTITLDPLPSSVHVGDQINFTGSLHTSQGAALTGATIYIQDEDTGSGDDILAHGVTDDSGRFLIPWTAQQQDPDTELEIRAAFEESGPYLRSVTDIQKMSVVKYSGSITLDTFPDRAKIGDMLIFSGTLTLESRSPEGAAIYIKDEDTLNPDDLLATAFADTDGRFSANWSVTDVDPDSVADIYAVFEGNDRYHRLTTCDDAPTDAFGGICNNTISLHIGDFVTPPPVNPDPDRQPYMELFYAKNLTKDPHVVIVPSRDSFNAVRGHITPVQDGIKMWTSMLESRNGGNWDVSFEVMTPGKTFRDSSADIIVNLVTHETQVECIDTWYGVAWPSQFGTVNTVVCSTSYGLPRSNDGVAATSAHEFIHAMGLGHTFNKPGDLMCSVENDVPTCKHLNQKSKIPSVFNLAAIEAIYGTDGYRVPNNSVKYQDRFYEDGRVVTPTSPLYAAVTGPNQITVTFAEQINVPAENFANLNLAYDSTMHGRNVTAVQGGPNANDVTITFGGAPVPTSAIATFDIVSGIADGSRSVFANIVGMAASDGQAPIVEYVTISSSGTGDVATVGDTIRLEFAFSEGTGTPVVTINGNNVVPAKANGIWTATRTVDETDPVGAVTFSISGYADLAGNAGTRVVSTTDDTAVTVESVQLAAPVCIGDQTLNSLTNQCDDPVCGTGQELNPDTRICEAVQQPAAPVCIGDQTLNSLTNQCDDPVCAPGYELNPDTRICETVQPPAAPTKAVISGTVFSDDNWNGIRDAGESGIAGYSKMIAIDFSNPENVMEAVTASDGSYSFEMVPGRTVLVQTSFFPQGHVVYDPATSWYTYVTSPAAGDVINFDVGFHPVAENELVEFEMRTFIDENQNRQRDPGERGVQGLGGTDYLTFFTYTYTIGPTAYPLTGHDGVAKAKLVPADFALFVDIAALESLGYYWTSTNYERTDDHAGKSYDPTYPLADDPEPGSKHVMDIGLWVK